MAGQERALAAEPGDLSSEMEPTQWKEITDSYKCPLTSTSSLLLTTHTGTQTQTHMHTHTHSCIHMHTQVCTCVHTYMQAHTHNKFKKLRGQKEFEANTVKYEVRIVAACLQRCIFYVTITPLLNLTLKMNLQSKSKHSRLKKNASMYISRSFLEQLISSLK